MVDLRLDLPEPLRVRAFVREQVLAARVDDPVGADAEKCSTFNAKVKDGLRHRFSTAGRRTGHPGADRSARVPDPPQH
jgi:hypothetical protein